MSRFNSHLTEEMENPCEDDDIKELTEEKRTENTEALKAIFPNIYFEFTHIYRRDGHENTFE